MFNIKDILLILKKRLKLIIIAGVIGCAVAAFITYKWVQPTYTSTASFYVINDNYRDSSEISSSELSASQRLVKTYIVVLQSDTTMRQVSQKLEELGYYYTTSQLKGMTGASSINDTEAFRVSVTTNNPELSKTIATIILDVLPAELIRVVEAGSVKVIDTASYPTAGYYPIKKNIAMGLAVGVACAVVYALLYAVFDTRVHGEEDLKRVFTIPIIGYIPSYNLDEELPDQDAAIQQAEAEAKRKARMEKKEKRELEEQKELEEEEENDPK